MKFNKILVTGAAGFIGFHLSRQLLEKGNTVVGLDNINDYYDPGLKYARLNELGINKAEASYFNKTAYSSKFEKFTFIRMNLENKNEINNLFISEKFDAVIHLAAQAGVRYSLENPDAYINSNIVGFLNILEGCRHHKIKHLIYASSSSVYGNNAKIPFSESDQVDAPVSLYAATKKSNELMAHSYSHLYNIPTSGLRFFTVYGPWSRPDMAPILFADAITKGEPIKVFNNGDMYRDFTYIDDIVNGIIITLNNTPIKGDNNPPYQLFNIGNGQPVHLKQFIELIELNIGKKSIKHNMPMQAGDVAKTWASTTELERLGYKSSVNINDGIKSFIKWYKTNNEYNAY